MKTSSHHTKQWFIDNRKIDEYIKLPDFETRNKLKTNMCKDGDKCKRKATCFFAHTESEKRNPICSYGSRCFFTSCKFDHTADAVLPELPYLKHKNIDFTVELSDNDEPVAEIKRKEKKKKKLFVKIFKEEKELVDKVYDEMAKSPSTFKKTKEQQKFFDSINITKEKVEQWEEELKQDEEKIKKEKEKLIKKETSKPAIGDFSSSRPAIVFYDSDDEYEDLTPKKETKLSIPIKEEEKVSKSTQQSLLDKIKSTKRRLEIMCSDEEYEVVLKMLKAFDIKEF
jgi:hypothetical protein